MLTRVILAAGVAALAISAPASGKPDRERGGQAAHAQRADRPQRAERVQRAERPQRAQRVERMRPQRVERQAHAQRAERVQSSQRQERHAQRERQPRHEVRSERVQSRQADRRDVRANRVQQVDRRVERQQVRANKVQQARNFERRDVRAERQMRNMDLKEQRQVLRADRQMRNMDLKEQRQVLRAERQAHALDLRADTNAVQRLRAADLQVFRDSRIGALTPNARILAPTQVVRYVGQPLSALSSVVPLVAVPQQISYLYPDTPDYYYRYGDGYLYQVDRGSNLIAALLPLLAGGYMPGTYLPNYYMNSYVPSYYGLNSFYPASYNGAYNYGYGYDNLCNRYANGVIYRVDCMSGMIVDVVPMYAGGYGVGQLLPSSYSYYNVPYQYRSLYPASADYGYWYGPGAIYQYDPSTSLITSVAALLSPGLTVGQQLPLGYNVYNVPYAYRTNYYDTADAWYRYNNGYIYRVDPTTQLVTAIVASILT